MAVLKGNLTSVK